MVSKLFMVGFGGMLGSVVRYGLSGLVYRLWTAGHFPWGTWVVNITGCFAIGILAAWHDGQYLSPEWRLLVIVGFLGGFTTFSTLSLESVELLRSGQWGWAMLNTFGQVTAGLFSAYGGWILGRITGSI